MMTVAGTRVAWITRWEKRLLHSLVDERSVVGGGWLEYLDAEVGKIDGGAER